MNDVSNHEEFLHFYRTMLILKRLQELNDIETKEKYGDEYPILFYEPKIYSQEKKTLRELIQGNKAIHLFSIFNEIVEFDESHDVSFILVVSNDQDEQRLLDNLQHKLEDRFCRKMLAFEEEKLFDTLFKDMPHQIRKSFKAYNILTNRDCENEERENNDEEEVMVMKNIKHMTQEFRQEFSIIWYDPKPSLESKHRLEKQAEIDITDDNIFNNFADLLNRINNYSDSPYHLIFSGNNYDEVQQILKEIDNLQDLLGLYIYSKDQQKVDHDKFDHSETLEDLIPQLKQGIRTRSKLNCSFPAFATNFDASDRSDIYKLHYYLKGLTNFTNRKQAKNDFLKLAQKVYQDKNKELLKFDDQYCDYGKEDIIRWYTRDSPIYRLINNCLRISSSDSILYCRLILKDLERAIREHYKSKSKYFNGLVYRGSFISGGEWEKLQRNLGQEIEMYGFLSTTVNKRTALNFLQSDLNNKILISIIIPPLPEIDEQGFADISEFSEYKGEKEILFNVRSRFKILEAGMLKINIRGAQRQCRHLVLFYAPQLLRRYMTEFQPKIKLELNFPSAVIKCNQCESQTHLFGFNRNEKTEVHCHDCLVNNSFPNNTPLLALNSENITENTKILTALNAKLFQFDQPGFSFEEYYGYECHDCHKKGGKKYYKWINMESQQTRNQCIECFCTNKESQEKNILLSEKHPYVLWQEYQPEWEKIDSDFQKQQSTQQAKSETENATQSDVYLKVQSFDLCIQYEKKVLSKLIRKRFREKRKLQAYEKIGRAYEELRDHKKAFMYCQEAVNIGEFIYPENHPDVASLNDLLASICDSLGKFNQAIEYHKKALYIRRDIFPEIDPHIAVSYNNLAALYWRLGFPQEALTYHKKSLRIQKEIYGEKHPQSVHAFNNVGTVYYSLGKHQKAMKYFSKTLDVTLAIYGEKHPETATLYNNLVTVYQNMEEYQKALEYCLKSFDLWKAIYGEDDPFIAVIYSNLASTYLRLGDKKKAEEYNNKSLSMRKYLYDSKDSRIATSINNIAAFNLHSHNYQQALEVGQEALDMTIAVFGENHPDTAGSYNNLAAAYHGLGRLSQARTYYEKTLGILLEKYDETHPQIATTEQNLAIILRDLGEMKGHHRKAQKHFRQALEFEEKALDIRLDLFGEKHSHTASSYRHLANIQFGLRKFQEARHNYKKYESIKYSCPEKVFKCF